MRSPGIFGGFRLLSENCKLINTGKSLYSSEAQNERGKIKLVLESQKTALLRRLQNFNDKYEEYVGLADVQAAQKKVKEAELIFLGARSKERTILRQMVATREKLKNVRERLSHVDYSNTMYLQLASEQHELVNIEESQRRELEEAEDLERDSFIDLSNAMRESYEHERARVERTKYWSIIGTVIGTLIGMMGSIYVNRVRTKDLMKAVKESGNKNDLAAKIDTLSASNEEQRVAFTSALNIIAENIVEMGNALQVQNLQAMAGFVNESLTDQQTRAIHPSQPDKKSTHVPLTALTHELSNYNVALTSLANAVTALSNAGAPLDSSSSMKIEVLLQKQIESTNLLQNRLDEMITSANELGLSGINSQLKEIKSKLSSITFSNSIESEFDDSPIIRELHSEDETPPKEPNWGVGVKDVVLWGSVLCCLYMFIKF
uniref:mitochondrial potassium channel-like n=1 Tax=Styela clava TaxID=7725 RepID=UPI00193A5595|nr:mitochondrial potassium channel-like [Styela clava]